MRGCLFFSDWLNRCDNENRSGEAAKLALCCLKQEMAQDLRCQVVGGFSHIKGVLLLFFSLEEGGFLLLKLYPGLQSSPPHIQNNSYLNTK